MADNPLTPNANASHTPVNGADSGQDPAVALIRQKLASIYSQEPNATQERQLADQPQVHHSKHQQFMHQLSGSGKSLADIQTAWHQYYASLPDEEKRAVWQEFYQQHHTAAQPTSIATPAAYQPVQAGQPEPLGPSPSVPNITTPRVPDNIYPTPTALNSPLLPQRQQSATAIDWQAQQQTSNRTDQGGLAPANDIKHYDDSGQPNPDIIRQQLTDKISRRAKLKPRHHLQSLLFGLGCGGLALLVVLFSFFNEMFIAPFLQPSRTVSATPIIIGNDGIAPTGKAEVIIPKINVQIPLDFSAKSIKEDDIQQALEAGVAHYPTTVMPGQKGNTAFFGHSSNNIFNPGQYKFAFVLLHELVPGDTFYLTRDGVAYAYQVIDKKIVDPTEVGILDPIPGKAATATLITCDPPGTTLRRLAVIGEQVSPNPTNNVPGAPTPVFGDSNNTSRSSELPGPPPSLWQRLTGWITD